MNTSAVGARRAPAQGSRAHRLQQDRQVRCNVSKQTLENGDLEERIASGKYSNPQGSNLERLSRPARKLLSKDPVGPGAILTLRVSARAGLAQPGPYLIRKHCYIETNPQPVGKKT